MEDGRCKLGLAGRLQLVRLIESGCSFRAAADESAVSVATAHRWWRRWTEASAAEQASRSCLRARPPVPKSCPWALSAEAERRILQARARTNLGPARLAGLVGYRRSTIWKVLRRHGCSQRRRTPRPRFTRRYEWAEPGALLHMDAKQLPVFTEPGHWAHGNRFLQQRRPLGSRRLEFAHVVVDDHSRLAYVEVHRHDRGDIAAQVLLRAAAWMTEQGAGPVEAVMTDNAFAYTKSNAFTAALAQLQARHIRIPPRTPRWNGKAERFIRTLDEEWAHGRIWPDSTRRNRALASFLRYYNRRRPHTSLSDRPPISRVHQDRGQNS
jgi:transposase InsO family protein